METNPLKNKSLQNDFTIAGAVRTKDGITGTIKIRRTSGTVVERQFYSTTRIDYFYFDDKEKNSRYFFYWFM